MTDTDQDNPPGKPGQRNRKAERRRQKAAERQSPTPDQSQDAQPGDGNEQIEATRVSTDASTAASPVGEVAATESSTVDAAAAPAPVPISLQTIANAYGDYTRKSLDETRSFVEQLTGVRSLDKAIEIQAAFAKHAYETFLADSQKIWKLYNELAQQIFKPLQGFPAKATHITR